MLLVLCHKNPMPCHKLNHELSESENSNCCAYHILLLHKTSCHFQQGLKTQLVGGEVSHIAKCTVRKYPVRKYREQK